MRYLMLALGMMAGLGATGSRAASPADAPGYGQAPICLMGDCDQVQGSRDAGASTASIATAGMGQGGRMSPGQSRPISMKLPNGGYQCMTITNHCSGDVFIPANSSGEWGSFLSSSCVSSAPCSYGLVPGAWEPWSASCGPASHSRWLSCQRQQDGRYVDISFCGGSGVETEATCFSCPQTSCTKNADGSTHCVTDDQCGNRSETYSPPPPPPPTCGCIAAYDSYQYEVYGGGEGGNTTIMTEPGATLRIDNGRTLLYTVSVEHQNGGTTEYWGAMACRNGSLVDYNAYPMSNAQAYGAQQAWLPFWFLSSRYGQGFTQPVRFSSAC